MTNIFSTDEIYNFMRVALEEAHNASLADEVPVGAVIVKDKKIIAAAHNEVELRKDSTAHAECLAIQAASKTLDNWRLTDAALFVTLEPCAMCMGALQLARISTLVFGAYDARMGAAGSYYDISEKQLRVIGGVCEEACANVLKDFFNRKR